MNFLISNDRISQKKYKNVYSFKTKKSFLQIHIGEGVTTLKNYNGFSLMIGTPIYKGVKFENILEFITNDFINNKLTTEDIKGNYLFLFIYNKQISILQDRGRQLSLFYDKQTKSLSTSLLQLAHFRKENLECDEGGLLEKMALGFNLSEKTVFKDIIKVTFDRKELIQNDLNINFINHKEIDIHQIEFHNKGRTNSLQKQVNHLIDYFSLINKTFLDKAGDLGLSGGFDCRLILALAEKEINTKLHLHTHFTEGAHESQIKYAELLSKEYDQVLDKTRTILPKKLSEEDLNKMLEQNNLYFDARSARHLGAYSQTYTSWYKKESMGNAFYSLNGLGGEIYRDSYFTGKRKMKWDEWAKRYLFLPLAYELLPKNELDKLSIKLKKQIENQLNWSKGYYDILFTHAYYGLIKMPLCNGNLVTAYNKTSPFLLPFIEPDNVMEAIKAIPYLGIGGNYQAKMINKISPGLAKIENHYGGSFSKLGFKYLLWSFIKTKGSLSKREQLVNKKLSKKSKSQNIQDHKELLKSNTKINDGLVYLKNIYPDYKVSLALTDSTQERNLIFTVFVLQEYFSRNL